MTTPVKQCIKCKEIKGAGNFYKESRVRDGLTARCKKCIKADADESYKENRSQVLDRLKNNYNSRKNKDNNLKRLYGMTIEEWEVMWEEQGMCCAICKTVDPKHASGSFVVDHCHSKLHVRGILCGPCNIMLGLSRDSIETLKAAIAYLGGECDFRSIAERKEELGLSVNETALLLEAQRKDLQVIGQWKSDGASTRKIAERLNKAKIAPIAHFPRWTAKAVESVLNKQHSYLDMPTGAMR